MTSAFDAEALASLDARLPPISVITNGVDTDYFRPDTDAESEPDRIVFSGKMSFYANDDAARHLLSDILPRLRALRPAVRLSIVGSRPSARLRTLAARAGGLEVTGQVGDMRPHLARAAIAVCPLRIAVGVQNKALEAMAMERPVICTPIAAKGFSPEAAACGAIRIAETPDAFAAACARLLADPDAARESGILARTYVESFHRWETAAAAFSRLYEGAIG